MQLLMLTTALLEKEIRCKNLAVLVQRQEKDCHDLERALDDVTRQLLESENKLDRSNSWNQDLKRKVDHAYYYYLDTADKAAPKNMESAQGTRRVERAVQAAFSLSSGGLLISSPNPKGTPHSVLVSAPSRAGDLRYETSDTDKLSREFSREFSNSSGISPRELSEPKRHDDYTLDVHESALKVCNTLPAAASSFKKEESKLGIPET